MGDLVRDALRAVGIDEEVEQVIADALVQSWRENRSTAKDQPPASERKLRTSATEPNIAKVRIVAEQVWRRLERIYDAKLQAWKENEEKAVEEMIARLRHEYKENLLVKQRQLEELAERKGDEYRNKEDLLRQDIRVTFEKKKLECERAWREIEAAQKEVRFRKELLENAQANFQSKKENELYRIEQERHSLERFKESLKMHEKTLDERLQEAVHKTREKDRAQMAQMVSEWNKKEAMLAKKYGIVWDKIREISTGQQFSAQEATRLKKLEDEVNRYQKKLAETTHALHEAQEGQRKMSEDMGALKKEKEMLSKENQNLKEKLSRRESAINSLKKRLTLVEESAAIRINDLKLHQRLARDKLQAIDTELRKYHSKELEKLNQRPNPPATMPDARMVAMLDSDSLSSSTLTETSSFEQHFRERMKTLDVAKQQLDFSVEKLRLRGHSEPVDYIQTLLLPQAETADSFRKSVPSNLRDHGAEQLRRVSVDNREANASQSSAVGNESPLRRPKSPVVLADVREAEGTEATAAGQSSLRNAGKKHTEMNVTDKSRSSSSGKTKIDPLMLRYMKMIEEQRSKEKSTIEQPAAAEGDNMEQLPSEESFDIEAPEKSDDTPKTPSDFGW